MTAPGQRAPGPLRRAVRLLPLGWRRRVHDLRTRRPAPPPTPAPSVPARPGRAAATSPVDWSMRKVWARRELYTLALPQARLDLERSPFSPDAEPLRTVQVDGPALVATYAAGELVLRAPEGSVTGETHYRFFALEPFATVEADLTVTGSALGVAMIEWTSADATTRITVAARRDTGTIGAELRVSGSSVAVLEDTAADLNGPFTLIAQLQGRSVLVWHRRDQATTYVGRLDLTAHLDLRDPATAAGWTVGLSARGHTDLEVRCARFVSTLSGNGHADPRVVTHEDGAPVQDGTTVWFLATTRGAAIPDAFQGVYALDVGSGEITMTGALFAERDGDGVRRNDNAGHLVHDRRTGSWTWLAVSHSDHPDPRSIVVGTSSDDLRHGVHHVPVERVAMPVDTHWEDMYPVHDGTGWVATASKDARRTAWLESSDGLAGPWTETRPAVGMDETGQLLVSSGGRRYVVAGTTTTAFVVRDADDAAMPVLGHLDVDVDTGGRRTWPALFALDGPEGKRWFLLSFDRTSPAERYSYGALHFYRQA